MIPWHVPLRHDEHHLHEITQCDRIARFFYNFWQSTSTKICPMPYNLWQKRFKVCQIQKNRRELFRFCQSGKISPNHVTLALSPTLNEFSVTRFSQFLPRCQNLAIFWGLILVKTGKICNLLGKIIVQLGILLLSLLQIAKLGTNNLAIWSHCSRLDLLSSKAAKSYFLDIVGIVQTINRGNILVWSLVR